ncbi:expressed unknown protein [Seminavis robusta]|uniref:Uncharacterized protein n=1 Tax=Seminavis robusta TaxID=568900 RepID=A0A9N8DRC0_9STRA|nr:expressed unknown protein [Seminavis robusta]|eukprot:Sro284_g107910.1 n/a (131) ;mRNA; f:33594-33986
MKKFPDNEGIQQFGISVMYFCFNSMKVDNPKRVDAVRSYVQDIDGIPIAVKGMKRWPDNMSVQEFGCKLFSGIIYDEDKYDHAMVEKSAVAAVSTTMQRHWNNHSNKSVKIAACRFMNEMFRNYGENWSP